MNQAKSEINVISPLFSKYFNRFLRIYFKDVGTCHDLKEDLRRTLLYMMATMNHSTRDIIIENNERLESNVICAYQLCYRLDISPADIRFKSDFSKTIKNPEKFLYLIAKSVAEPYKTSFVRGHRSCLDYEINISKKLLISLLKSHVQHELLHQIIGAPFNAYGEIYTILISEKLSLVSDSSEYNRYLSIFKKSKYISVDWKNKSNLYYNNVLKGRESLLHNILDNFESLILQGKIVDSKYFPNKEFLVYPETAPISFS